MSTSSSTGQSAFGRADRFMASVIVPGVGGLHQAAAATGSPQRPFPDFGRSSGGRQPSGRIASEQAPDAPDFGRAPVAAVRGVVPAPGYDAAPGGATGVHARVASAVRAGLPPTAGAGPGGGRPGDLQP